jgi:hypothetical protein
VLPGDDDFPDQALRDGLAFFKGEPVQVVSSRRRKVSACSMTCCQCLVCCWVRAHGSRSGFVKLLAVLPSP